MKLKLSLPEYQVSASLVLYTDAAPETCRLIWEALAAPLTTRTSHACFAGQQVFLFLPELATTPPLENQTMRPKPGEAMLFVSDAHEFAVTRDERLGGSMGFSELALMYGEVDLRHWRDEGMRGSLVGRLDGADIDAFVRACGKTLDCGSTPITVSRANEGAGPKAQTGADFMKGRPGSEGQIERE